MTRSTRGTTLLSWLMLLVGGAALFACLFLPAWLEYRAAHQNNAVRRQEIADLERLVTRDDKQIEYHNTDPAYIERLNRQEFGTEPPGVEIVRVEPRGNPTTDPVLPGVEAAQSEPLVVALEQASHTNPFVAVFVLDQTRPIVMAMSGALVIMALVLLIRRRPSKPL